MSIAIQLDFPVPLPAAAPQAAGELSDSVAGADFSTVLSDIETDAARPDVAPPHQPEANDFSTAIGNLVVGAPVIPAVPVFSPVQLEPIARTNASASSELEVELSSPSQLSPTANVAPVQISGTVQPLVGSFAESLSVAALHRDGNSVTASHDTRPASGASQDTLGASEATPATLDAHGGGEVRVAETPVGPQTLSAGSLQRPDLQETSREDSSTFVLGSASEGNLQRLDDAAPPPEPAADIQLASEAGIPASAKPPTSQSPRPETGSGLESLPEVTASQLTKVGVAAHGRFATVESGQESEARVARTSTKDTKDKSRASGIAAATELAQPAHLNRSPSFVEGVTFEESGVAATRSQVHGSEKPKPTSRDCQADVVQCATEFPAPDASSSATFQNSSGGILNSVAPQADMREGHPAPRSTVAPSLVAASANLPERQTGMVQSVRLLDQSGHAEMHIGMHTTMFGTMEVHTVVHDNQVSLTIASERGDLQSALRPEFANVAAAVQHHELQLNAVNIVDGSMSAGTGFSSGSHAQSRGFPHSAFQAGQAASLKAEWAPTTDEEPIAGNATTLSILV